MSLYNENQPYIFISYSHRDSNRVYPIINRLREEGYNVWYDDGIEPGSEWDENIASHIMKCAYFIALVSKNYLESANCKDELNYSRDLDKEQLLIYLEDVSLSGGMAMRMNRIQAVMWNKYDNVELAYQKLFSAVGIQKTKVFARSVSSSQPTQAPVALTMPVQPRPTQAPVAPAMPVQPRPTQAPVVPTMPVQPKPAQNSVPRTVPIQPNKVHVPMQAAPNAQTVVSAANRPANHASKSSSFVKPLLIIGGILLAILFFIFVIFGIILLGSSGNSNSHNSDNNSNTSNEGISLEDSSSDKTAEEYYNNMSQDEEEEWGYTIYDIEALAQSGDVEAMYLVAEAYFWGTDEVDIDYKAALYWYERAGDEGDIYCMEQAALLHYSGEGGVEKDYAKTISWCLKIIENRPENTLAYFYMGMCYEYGGYGVEKDEELGFIYLLQAAELGDVNAMYCVAACYKTGMGIEKNDELAEKWFQAYKDAGGTYEL